MALLKITALTNITIIDPFPMEGVDELCDEFAPKEERAKFLNIAQPLCASCEADEKAYYAQDDDEENTVCTGCDCSVDECICCPNCHQHPEDCECGSVL